MQTYKCKEACLGGTYQCPTAIPKHAVLSIGAQLAWEARSSASRACAALRHVDRSTTCCSSASEKASFVAICSNACRSMRHALPLASTTAEKLP